MLLLILIFLSAVLGLLLIFGDERSDKTGCLAGIIFLLWFIVFIWSFADKDTKIYGIDYRQYHKLKEYSQNVNKVTSGIRKEWIKKIESFNKTLIRKRKLNKSWWYDIVISDEVDDYEIIKLKRK